MPVREIIWASPIHSITPFTNYPSRATCAWVPRLKMCSAQLYFTYNVQLLGNVNLSRGSSLVIDCCQYARSPRPFCPISIRTMVYLYQLTMQRRHAAQLQAIIKQTPCIKNRASTRKLINMILLIAVTTIHNKDNRTEYDTEWTTEYYLLHDSTDIVPGNYVRQLPRRYP